VKLVFENAGGENLAGVVDAEGFLDLIGTSLCQAIVEVVKLLPLP
jgi:hypothetical protein